jgi:hypothetical protein
MNDIKTTYTDILTDDIDLALLAISEETTEDSFEVSSLVDPFVPIANPELAYLTTTSKLSFSTISDQAVVHSITDGFQTITFSTRMRKLESNQINNWEVPPFTEDPRPETLISDSSPFTMQWELSRPSKIFGFELMPNLFGTYTYRVDFYVKAMLAGSITRTIAVPGPPIGPVSHGARLFAAITDGPGFDRVVITSLSGNTLGFLVAQIRYQGCVTLCNPIIKEITTKRAEIPVTCCINIPGYEVISVCDNISARILDTCCEIHEDFIYPQYGPIPGIKTADVKIFAELLIPVTIQAYGCPPITLSHTCFKCAVFTIKNVFISCDIKNCEVLTVRDIEGFNFRISPTIPGLSHCCVEGCASLSATISACVMTNRINVIKCP